MRETLLPYGRQWIDEDDVEAVVAVLQSAWLTTGPKIGEFERAFADKVGAREAVAVSSGTAALHAAMFALEIGAGDEVIVPAMTFAASANCVVYQGGTPVFADVERGTLLLDANEVRRKITPRTRAIVAVDYTGHPCDYDALREIAAEHKLALVADACHAIGGSYQGRRVGTLADLSTFSLHPVKHITSGEGGVITTDDPALARRMRVFRNHGITTDHRERHEQGAWFYEMVELGFNYRITDLQCALGLSQLGKLEGWVTRRQEIARRYDEAFRNFPAITPLTVRENVSHAYHLYVIQLGLEQLHTTRNEVYAALRTENIGVNVHYIPVHLHPYYQRCYGTHKGMLPVAEDAYERILTLPMFAAMTDADVEDVIGAVDRVVRTFSSA